MTFTHAAPSARFPSGALRLFALGLVLSLGLIATACVSDRDEAVTPSPDPTSAQPVSNTPNTSLGTTALQAAPLDFADVVERAMPSVVFIEALTPVGASGSGMVLDRAGHILTNYHVIEGQTQIKVTLADGNASRATVIGSDPANDLAVIKAEDFPSAILTPVTFGDSRAIRVGEPVFAIGSPFTQKFSVSTGIISATARSITSSFTGRQIVDMLQTDAALNRGNSGGPLFNLEGEVIGINTSIENPDGRVFVGLGFAVPSNTAVRFLPQMLAGEEIQHSQLGVQGEPLDQLRAAELGLSVSRGMLITGVTTGSAADRAGVRAGDVIQVLNGQVTETLVQLVRAIDSAEVGEQVTVIVSRSGQEIALTATLQPWDVN